ncbi:MAG: hypothetical protein H0T62_12380 [Parachlamydiaceae bacterium]|nr:hypothetical protein [Parachlamydiaceae bacterium]
MLVPSIYPTKSWSDELDNAKQLAEESGTSQRQPLLNSLSLKSRNVFGTTSTSDLESMGPDTLDISADAKKIYRFIVGLDDGFPKVMTTEEVQNNLHDPFTRLLLAKGLFPLTTKAVVEELEKTQGQDSGLITRNVFLIGEGGKLPWDGTTDKVNRTFRFTFAIRINGGIGPDILISTGTNVESTKGFLQLMSWDPDLKGYHFFQRLGSLWIWSGNSYDALNASTRHKGPFSGHINGGPVMKELEQPWQNWHSMNATIALPSHHPLQQNPYFQEKGTGDQFEKLVKTGMDKLNQARIERSIINGAVRDFDFFMRQILDSLNVNLISSIQESRAVQADDSLPLPFSFFANMAGFSLADIEPDIEQIKVRGNIYLQSLVDFDFALITDGARIPGDTHFAFFVPEVSREDMNLLEKMIRHEMISKKMVASILMVDFPNPLYSEKRKSLLQYVPNDIKAGNQGFHFDEVFIENIKRSGKIDDPNLPEGELVTNWSLENWQEVFESRLIAYFKNLKVKSETQEGYNNFVRVAEYRRKRFMTTPLYEFDLTFAKTNMDASQFPLTMHIDGTVAGS